MSWYRKASWGQAPPSRENLDRIATEKAGLYRCRTPEGPRLIILVSPAEVEERFPEEVEIEQAVRDLKEGRAGGP